MKISSSSGTLRAWSNRSQAKEFITRCSSGELAANAIAKILRGDDRNSVLREFGRAYAQMYRGRLWINRLARAAVLRPQLGSLFVHAARIQSRNH